MYGPSLCRPTMLWAEFAMGRVCYGPRCPVTLKFLLFSQRGGSISDLLFDLTV